jgi:3-oxoacyl-[acyl-carrier protein] reductase
VKLPNSPSDSPARRTALVTGASRGIGRAIAGALAARGVRVALHYHAQAAAAEEARGGLAGDGHRLFAADLTDPKATARLWQSVMQTFGQVDILVNNAGLFFDHPPLTTAFEDWQAIWQHTLAANLTGPANLSLLAAQAMAARPQPSGSADGHGGLW